jgi:hypothetical protein
MLVPNLHRLSDNNGDNIAHLSYCRDYSYKVSRTSLLCTSDNGVYVNQARHALLLLLIRPAMSTKRAFTFHVEEAWQRQSEARADAGSRQLHALVGVVSQRSALRLSEDTPSSPPRLRC